MQTCSRCGGIEDLHLVTILYEPGAGAAGRMLLYCWPCRSTGPSFGVSVPIDLVTAETLTWMYATGQRGGPQRTPWQLSSVRRSRGGEAPAGNEAESL